MFRLVIYTLTCFHGVAMGIDKFGAPLIPLHNENQNSQEEPGDGADLPSIMRRYHPQQKHLKVKKLLRRLGNHFDPDWMAIQRPDRIPDSQNMVLHRNGTLDDTRTMVQTIIENKNITYDRVNMESIVNFLSQISTCEVKYKWSELGELFWPRYIKSGICTTTHSCSWPSGMTCVPGNLKVMHILRWRCKSRRATRGKGSRNGRGRNRRRSNSGKGRKLSCSWKKIPYHVPVDCVCSC